MTREIKISKELYVLVDDEDYDKVIKYTWHAQKNRNTFYAIRKQNNTTILMHRLILNPKNGEMIDHINGNGLDNRKINLRISTNNENQHNSKIRKDNTTGYKGVVKTRNNKYMAQIWNNGKRYHIGTFLTALGAAKAYNQKALELFGEFANINKD